MNETIIHQLRSLAKFHEEGMMPFNTGTALRQIADELEALKAEQPAPDGRGTDAQIIKEREIARHAIVGALAAGYAGQEHPGEDHWLAAAHVAGARIKQLEQPAAQVPDERASFEKLARERGFRLTRGGGFYLNSETQAAWVGWEARAILPASPEPRSETMGRKEWCQRACAVFIQAGDDPKFAQEQSEWLWGQQDFDDLEDPTVAAKEDIEGRPRPTSPNPILQAVDALLRVELDCVYVHPCDMHNDEVRARGLQGLMLDLYRARHATQAPKAAESDHSNQPSFVKEH